MNRPAKILILTGAVSAGLLLAACGGGSVSATIVPDNPVTATQVPTPTPLPAFAAEGLWRGGTSNGRTLTTVVLDNGNYWLLYSAVNNSNLIAGVVTGSATLSNGTFKSTAAKDLSLEGAAVNTVAIDGSFVAKKTLTGKLTYPVNDQFITLTTAYDADYDKVPTLANLAGTYSGTGAVKGAGEANTVIISNTGEINGTGESGCKFTGTAKPHARGNVYDYTIKFAGGDCLLGSSTLTGVGYYDAKLKRLYGAALNTDRSNGMIFIGTKP